MVLLCLIFLAVMSWAAAEPTGENQGFDQENLDSIVLVFTGSTLCSGTVVEPGDRVLTAYHCVASGGRPRVDMRDGRRLDARIGSVDVAHDMAVLHLPEAVGAGLALFGGVVNTGQEVWAVGHPFGVNLPGGFMEGTLRWSVSHGIVSAVGARAIQVSAPVNPGNSGGPVLDEFGQIVGVVSRRIAGDGLGFAGRSDIAKELLRREPGSRMGGFGGTAALQWVGSTIDGYSYAAGPELEVAFRDRVLVRANLQVGLNTRQAVIGPVRARSGGEVTLGLRQRLFRGPFAVRIDAYGGAVMLIEETADGAREEAWTWVGGAGVGVRSVGLDFALVDGQLRSLFRFRWPGVISVF